MNIYEGTCDDVANASVVIELGSLQGDDQNDDLAAQLQTLLQQGDATSRDLFTADEPEELATPMSCPMASPTSSSPTMTAQWRGRQGCGPAFMAPAKGAATPFYRRTHLCYDAGRA